MDLEPPTSDASGYVVTENDLRFLGLGVDAYQRWARRETPLGVRAAQYGELKVSLFAALDEDGLDDSDVRILGSSTGFFSGAHKPMLYGRAQLIGEFFQQFGRLPSEFETGEMVSKLAAQWDGPGPVQRPFDSFYVIGASRQPSDIDVHVSSRKARLAIEANAGELGVDLTEIRSQNEKYAFYVKSYVERLFPRLSLWRTYAVDLVRRQVTIAMFDETGPPEVDGPVSSHFRETDWVVER